MLYALGFFLMLVLVATGAKIQISWVRCCWTGQQMQLIQISLVRMLVLVQQVLIFKFLG
jgi:hypothetical protein